MTGFTETAQDKKMSKKSTCEVTDALKNHVTFPTLGCLGKSKLSSFYYNNLDSKTATPVRHWASVSHIHLVDEKNSPPKSLIGFSWFHEMNRVLFDLDDATSSPTTFSYSDMVEDNSVVILYPKRTQLSDTIEDQILHCLIKGIFKII